MMRALTDKQALAIKARYQAGNVTMSDLAREYGLSIPSISLLLRGLTYRHLPGAIDDGRQPMRALTPDQVAEARGLYMADPYATYAALARRFGCSYNTIRYAISGRSYRHIIDPPPVPAHDKTDVWNTNPDPTRPPPPPPPWKNARINRIKNLAQTLADVLRRPVAMVERGGFYDVVTCDQAVAEHDPPMFVAHPKDRATH